MLGVIAYPLGLSVWLSLSNAAPGTDGSWVGLANYQFLAGLATYRQVVLNTFVFSLASTAIKGALGLAMAIALQRDFRGRGIVYAVCFLPFVFPPSIGTTAWYYLLSNVHGAFNYALLGAHLIAGPIAFTGSGIGPMASVVTVNVWHGTALFGILCLAALRSIPPVIFDAAATDGATAWRRFLHIQLPLLRPALVLASLLSIVGNFGDFGIVFLLTGGGPIGKTDIISTSAFANALVVGDLGVGSTVALSAVPAYLVVLVVAFRLLRDR